ncbi:hypothetical protein R1sor_001681 [Riccia sorocarpa]|uniref:Uncharacterized protein n=1 Tax=Riccia sorocarpa TaxID=122646 RepID=A0ABD3H2I8_9MARC
MDRSIDGLWGRLKPREDGLPSEESFLLVSAQGQYCRTNTGCSSLSSPSLSAPDTDSGLQVCADPSRASKRRKQHPVAGKAFVVEKTPAGQQTNSGPVAVPVEALETTLRPDVIALGIESFECRFDQQRILCLRRRGAEDERFARLRFFHPEGMTQIIGVGLPFSEVLLREDGNLEVREMSPADWRRSWTAACIKDYSLIYFCRGSSAEEPYNSGYLEAEFHPRNTGISQTVEPVQWIEALVKLLRLSESMKRTRRMTKGLKLEYNRRSGSTSASDVGSSSSNPAKPGLTITVVLDSSRKELKVPVASDHVVQKPISGTSGCFPRFAPPVDNTRAVSTQTRTYQLGARVVVEFSSVADETGRSASRSFRSTLEVDFNMPLLTSTQSSESFGWYQNELGVSFQCMQDGAARKVSRTTDDEVISKHRLRESQRSCDRQETVSTVSHRSGTLVFGVRTPAKVGVSAGHSKEKTMTAGNKSQASTDTNSSMLEQGNLKIRYRGETTRLAYCFTHSPTPEQYNVWNVPEDRAELSCDLMTSNMPIEVTGTWKIVDGAEAVSNGVCQYEFSCARHLTMHQRVIVPSTSYITKKSKTVVEDYSEVQKMKKVMIFLITPNCTKKISQDPWLVSCHSSPRLDEAQSLAFKILAL